MGFVFNPIDPEVLRDPYPTYARLREEDPVQRHPAGMWVISRYDDVVRVLKDAEVFSSAAMGGPMPGPGGEARNARMGPTSGSLIGYDPPAHTQQRNTVSRGFTPRRIAALEPQVRTIAEELFAEFGGRGHCDLSSEFANPMPVTVIAELLGLDVERRDDFKRWSTQLIVGSTQGAGMARNEMLDTILEFRAYMSDVIEHRRRDPKDDLISVLIHAEEESGILSTDEVIGFASLLLAAGSETTTNLIGNALLALLAHPEQRDAVLAEPERIPDWIEETLRYDGPIQLLMRLTTRETEVAGVEIPKNAFVLVLLASANRDETQFPGAERFDIERRPKEHLGFGFGHHFCLGASLARLEATIALRMVLDRMPGLRVASDGPIARHGSFLVRGPAELPLAWSV